jgi:GNAT superfamily N-acetyltransferase
MTAHPESPPGLRRADRDDVRAIAEFQTRCWAEAYRGLVPQSYLDRMTVADREVRWRSRLASRRYRVLLAELDGRLSDGGLVGPADGRLIGVASTRRSQALALPRLELRTLYVDAAHRGAGVAAELLQAAIGTAPAFLWVFEENPRARRFYAKHGFAPDGHRKIDPDTGIWELRMVR